MAAQTSWVRNVETGLTWQVSEAWARYLLGQRTPQGDALYEQAAAPGASTGKGKSAKSGGE